MHDSAPNKLHGPRLTQAHICFLVSSFVVLMLSMSSLRADQTSSFCESSILDQQQEDDSEKKKDSDEAGDGDDEDDDEDEDEEPDCE